ncbi:MAG: beta-lactamase family protein [Ignavibacteria bacterium]|nr:beta-lactamase family protein [Ignavibacteria bacterium]
MKKLRIFLLVLSLIAPVSLFSGSDTLINKNYGNYEKVKNAVDSIRKNLEVQLDKKVPSLNLFIHTPSDYIFVSSVSENETPLTPDTHFRFASNTKNFTATAVLNMQEDRWLNINDRITDLIPGCNISYAPDIPEWNIPYKEKITIKQLLQHSAGVYDVDNSSVPGCDGKSYVEYRLSLNPDHQFSSSELVNQVVINNLYYFEPGNGHHYSNTGYTILSEIISRVYSFHSGSPKTYSDYLEDFITGSSSPVPLDVRFPYLYSDCRLPEPYVKGRETTENDSVIINDEINMSAHVAEGNGYGNFIELDKYISSLMKGENVLSKSSIDLMKSELSPGSNTYALGSFYVPNLGYGHNGCIYGYLSYMLYDPVEDISLIIMMPYLDFSKGMESFSHCFNALLDAGYSARSSLGFSGKP